MDNLKGKRILITGGNGYLGKNLARELTSAGASVFILDRVTANSENEFSTDITNLSQVEETVKTVQPQIIFHLAANLNRNRNFEAHDQLMAVNYTGTLNLLKALQLQPYENFIFTSSSEVYGNQQAPFHETLVPVPVSPYSLSKFHAENLIRTFSDIHKKPFVILRLFNFFGFQMPDSFFIPQLVNTLRSGSDFEMTGGEQIRDFLFINDVIDGLCTAAVSPNAIGEILNLCNGSGITLKDLANIVSQQIPGEGNVLFGALPYRENEIWNMIGSSEKMKKLTGFNAKYSIYEGIHILLSEIINHQKTNK